MYHKMSTVTTRLYTLWDTDRQRPLIAGRIENMLFTLNKSDLSESVHKNNKMEIDLYIQIDTSLGFSNIFE